MDSWYEAASCRGKVPHATQKDARQHLRSLQRRRNPGSSQINVYKCEHCPGWHIGSRPKSAKLKGRSHRMFCHAEMNELD